MKPILEELVRCPKCRKSACTLDESGGGPFTCGECAATYPAEGGIVDLVYDQRFEASLAQALMQSPTMARIYEGTLWRQSGWQQRTLGLAFADEAEVTLQAAGVQETSTVLDLACGSGIYTRRFARVASEGRVVGLDLSMPMLKWAAQKDRDAGVENVAYLRASALDLPFEDGSFDRVNCCGALHLFPDLPKVLAEVRRILKPSGRFTAGTFRKRPGFFGRMRTRSGHPLGVDCFTPEGLGATLEEEGFTHFRVHRDAARWMILSGERG